MNKKIVVIGIIGVFVLSSFGTVSGTEINKSVVKSVEQNIDINGSHRLSYSYKFKGDNTESTDTTIPENAGEVDFAVEDVLAWWSPAPWFEDLGLDYKCHQYVVKNVGAPYEGEGVLKLFVYWIYSDGHTQEGSYEEISQGYWNMGLIEGGMEAIAYPEKPVKMMFKIETDLPEKNLENNVVTVYVGYGVTINGTVCEQDSSGENHPVENGVLVAANSEYYPSLGFIFYVCPTFNGNNYCICSPKKSETSPFEYTVIAYPQEYKSQSKKTEPLSDFDYTRLDFIFKAKSKSVHLLEKLLQRFPLLEKLLSLPIIKKIF